MYLLDTHTLLWFLYGSDRISERAQEIICKEDPIYASIVSFWEIAIKQGLKKLENQDSIERIAEVCREKGIDILQIAPKELEAVKSLPDIHRDPFDRLLIAQAKVRGLTFLTRDKRIAQYDCIDTIWE